GWHWPARADMAILASRAVIRRITEIAAIGPVGDVNLIAAYVGEICVHNGIRPGARRVHFVVEWRAGQHIYLAIPMAAVVRIEHILGIPRVIQAVAELLQPTPGVHVRGISDARRAPAHLVFRLLLE